jgi:nucleoside-diphosphate kinase
MAEDRYVFVVEWFDSAASLVRSYNLTYFLKDKSIEMVLPSPRSTT